MKKRYYSHKIIGGHRLFPSVVRSPTSALGTHAVALAKSLAKQMQQIRLQQYSQCTKHIYNRTFSHVQRELHNTRQFLLHQPAA